MKTRLVVFLNAAVFVLLATAADAQRLPSKRPFTESLGNVTSDTITWFASGTAILGVTVKVDTLVANESPDTSFVIPIQGAESVILELLTREAGNDSGNVAYRFQVGSSPDTTAMWHTLSAAYTAAFSFGATATSDTTVVILHSDHFMTIIDTLAATTNALEETGVQIVPQADRAQVRGMRYLRLINDAAGRTLDTVYVTGVVTKRYPGQ